MCNIAKTLSIVRKGNKAIDRLRFENKRMYYFLVSVERSQKEKPLFYFVGEYAFKYLGF